MFGDDVISFYSIFNSWLVGSVDAESMDMDGKFCFFKKLKKYGLDVKQRANRVNKGF